MFFSKRRHYRKAGVAAVAFALVTLNLTRVDSQPYQGVVGWHISVADADSTGRTYRVYDFPREVTVLLTMLNESRTDLSFDDARLQERVRFSITGNRDIPVNATWPPIQESGKSQLGFESTTKRSILWKVALSRKDGQQFTTGHYRLNLSVTSAHEVVRTPDAKPLRGVAGQAVEVFLVIEPPTNARERAAAYRLLGKKTLGENTPEGLRLLVLATQADPTDLRVLIELGNAYIQTGRCRDAIPVLERALGLERQLTSARRSGVYTRLAYAYVCVGDEVRAEQVLREGGGSKVGITKTIEQYRETVPR